MTDYSSLAIANCEFTFDGIPPFTASFSASASDTEKKKALKLSKKVVSKLIKNYIKESSYILIKKDVKIEYKVKKYIVEPEKTCGCSKG
jgi:hypothetical protein